MRPQRLTSRFGVAFLAGAAVVSGCACHPCRGDVAAPMISIRSGAPDGWMRLSSSLHSNTVLRLEASTDLESWQAIGTLHEGLFDYPDAGSAGLNRRFYRLHATSMDPDSDWKNQVLFPEERFLSEGTNQMRWVKFGILTSDPTRVIYEDSLRYLFHYDFATVRLAPFLGMDPLSFDAVSLYRTNQQIVLGAVLYPPGTNLVEYGVQFVGLDPYTPEEIARWFDLVKATVWAQNGAGIYYMPTFEQTAAARTNAEALAALGVPVASVDRWATVNTCYSTGWALGRLQFIPAGEIDAAFADGRLRTTDILLTDGVPAETPLVAGIISLMPSTPNSHTAILARSFGIPFVYFPALEDQQWVQSLAGRKIILTAALDGDTPRINVIDVEGILTPELEAQLLAMKQPPEVEFMPKQHLGIYSRSVDVIGPLDIRYFGGKAANYGLLRDSIPGNCPVAVAFSFDLWDDYMDQTLAGGGSLREAIAARLAPYTNYPPDILALKADLDDVRDLITKSADFTPEQKQAITNTLAIFNPHRKIRFRSSTNIEDSEHFVGAGLYDSYSGCLIDDLDSDASGPSACDPSEPEERGVFRAMRKVYASFYNDNAFLERLRFGIDESQVGMGVLVHHSFPDEEELANGVATLRAGVSAASTNLAGNMVTQFGAASVTNPDGTSVPEVVQASRQGATNLLVLTQHSSLIPLGAYTMNWQSDYTGFMDLFTAVAYGFRQVFPQKTNAWLDFEYKKDLNLGLVVKQVREVPDPDATNNIIPFLIQEPGSYRILQAGGEVFALHRLKSLWQLNSATIPLTSSNIAAGIYTDGTVNYVADGAVQTLSGPLHEWPNAAMSGSPEAATNTWTTGAGTNLREWELATRFVSYPGAPPVQSIVDCWKELRVAYARPVPTSFGGTTSNDFAVLEPDTAVPYGAIAKVQVAFSGPVFIQTWYLWPPQPGGPVAGYTAPLVKFLQTQIAGLTTTPMILTNYFSQTYSTTHHNFTEDFVFEPRLDPNVSASALAELEAAGIRQIYLQCRGTPVIIYIPPPGLL